MIFSTENAPASTRRTFQVLKGYNDREVWETGGVFYDAYTTYSAKPVLEVVKDAFRKHANAVLDRILNPRGSKVQPQVREQKDTADSDSDSGSDDEHVQRTPQEGDEISCFRCDQTSFDKNVEAIVAEWLPKLAKWENYTLALPTQDVTCLPAEEQDVVNQLPEFIHGFCSQLILKKLRIHQDLSLIDKAYKECQNELRQIPLKTDVVKGKSMTEIQEAKETETWSNDKLAEYTDLHKRAVAKGETGEQMELYTQKLAHYRDIAFKIVGEIEFLVAKGKIEEKFMAQHFRTMTNLTRSLESKRREFIVMYKLSSETIETLMATYQRSQAPHATSVVEDNEEGPFASPSGEDAVDNGTPKHNSNGMDSTSEGDASLSVVGDTIEGDASLSVVGDTIEGDASLSVAGDIIPRDAIEGAETPSQFVQPINGDWVCSVNDDVLMVETKMAEMMLQDDNRLGNGVADCESLVGSCVADAENDKLQRTNLDDCMQQALTLKVEESTVDLGVAEVIDLIDNNCRRPADLPVEQDVGGGLTDTDKGNLPRSDQDARFEDMGATAGCSVRVGGLADSNKLISESSYIFPGNAAFLYWGHQGTDERKEFDRSVPVNSMPSMPKTNRAGKPRLRKHELNEYTSDAVHSMTVQVEIRHDRHSIGNDAVANVVRSTVRASKEFESIEYPKTHRGVLVASKSVKEELETSSHSPVEARNEIPKASNTLDELNREVDGFMRASNAALAMSRSRIQAKELSRQPIARNAPMSGNSVATGLTDEILLNAYQNDRGGPRGRYRRREAKSTTHSIVAEPRPSLVEERSKFSSRASQRIERPTRASCGSFSSSVSGQENTPLNNRFASTRSEVPTRKNAHLRVSNTIPHSRTILQTSIKGYSDHVERLTAARSAKMKKGF